MSVMPVRTDPGLHYSQEVYMMETMQHNAEHKQTHTHTNTHMYIRTAHFFTVEDKTVGSILCGYSILRRHEAASMILYIAESHLNQMKL